jgi:flagellar motor switch protein FliN/FliY
MPDDENVVSQDEIDKLLAEMNEETAAPAAAQPASPEKKDPTMDPAAWGLSADDLQSADGAAVAEPAREPATPTRDVRFQNLARDEEAAGAARSLEFVLDIPLLLTVEVGRTRMTIGDLLHLGPGNIVELTKMAGEPLEVFVNDKLVARGEAVIINEKFGIRLTDVISRTERIESLK